MVASPTNGDGFDMYNGQGPNIGAQARWYITGSVFVPPSLVTGRFGYGQGIFFNSPTRNLYMFAFMSNTGTLTVAFGVDVLVDNPANGMPNSLITVCNAAGAPQCGVGISSTGQIFSYRGTTVLGSSAPGIILANTWHRIEGEITLSATVGAINVYLDQPKTSPVTLSGCTVSGVNTLGAGTGGGDVIALGSILSNWGGAAVTFDNFLYNNASATRMGPLRAETLRPNGNSSVAWTPSSGSNYSCVNGLVVNGSTFVESSTVSAADKYTITPLSETPPEIAAVNMVIFAQKSDAGGRSVDASTYSGGTEADGSTITLATQYQRYDPNMMVVDPNTSASWLPPNVNALLIGPKLAA